MIHLQRKIIKTMKRLILKVYMLVFMYIFIHLHIPIHLHIYIFVYIYTHAHARTHIRTDSLSLSLSDTQNPCNKRHKDITQYIRKPYQKIWCTIFHSRAEVCMDTHGSFFSFRKISMGQFTLNSQLNSFIAESEVYEGKKYIVWGYSILVFISFFKMKYDTRQSHFFSIFDF